MSDEWEAAETKKEIEEYQYMNILIQVHQSAIAYKPMLRIITESLQ